MEKNVGKTDKIIRYILGVIFLISGYVLHFPYNLNWIFYVLGIVLIVVATINYCPLYPIFKMNTNK